MCKRLLFLLGILGMANCLNAQDPPATEEEYEERYQRRITQSHLNGVYIPKDLADAFNRLNQLISPESMKKFKGMSEKDATHKLHFSLGRWLIYNWGFYEGSRLSHYLKGLGLSHPDDMARFIIITYHRQLNRQSLEVKPLLEQLIEQRQQSYFQGARRDTVSRRKRADVPHGPEDE